MEGGARGQCSVSSEAFWTDGAKVNFLFEKKETRTVFLSAARDQWWVRSDSPIPAWGFFGQRGRDGGTCLTSSYLELISERGGKLSRGFRFEMWFIWWGVFVPAAAPPFYSPCGVTRCRLKQEQGFSERMHDKEGV